MLDDMYSTYAAPCCKLCVCLIMNSQRKSLGNCEALLRRLYLQLRRSTPCHLHCMTNCYAIMLAGHPSKHAISTNSEAAGELLSISELEARRPDGFKFITAPVLRGEGNWPSISLYAPMEQRIHVTVDALLARIPFWLKVSSSQGFILVPALVGTSSRLKSCLNSEMRLLRLLYTIECGPAGGSGACFLALGFPCCAANRR